MKRILLASACILFAAFSAQAQAPTMNIINNTTYTVYVSGQTGTACTPAIGGNYTATAAPGVTSMTTGGNDYLHIRVYSYDPASGSACNPNPINSINLSPCGGLPLTDMLDIYDTCPGPTPYTATVTWDNSNSPTSVDVIIN